MTAPDDPRGTYSSPLAMAQAADRPLGFVRALRWLREDASRSFQQLANTAQGELPKSTAHYMTTVAREPERTRLPARQEQVALFVRGCGRPESEVQAWVAEWRRIKDEMKLATQRTVRLPAVPATPPEPPRRTGTGTGQPEAEPAATRHPLLPVGTWMRRIGRWLRFPAVVMVLMVVMVMTVSSIPGVGDTIGGPALAMFTLAPTMFVYVVLSRRIGHARRTARESPALADRRPAYG